MDLHQLVDIFLHLDKHLNDWAGQLGGGLYGILFAIIFCETGLVVTPFLPGDSLLFAVGALCATSDAVLSLPLVMALMFAAAVLGDAVNYSIGRRLGPAVFRSEGSIFLNKKHLDRTQAFYERHGGKTIILARFTPIIRTFAPFVAGIGKMAYGRFLTFNLVGAAAWVLSMTMAGYVFGNIEVVKKNFSLVVLGIVALSIMPAVIEYLRSRRGPEPHPVAPKA